jgi:hypothetical protein
VLTYPQYSESDNLGLYRSLRTPGNFANWCQVIDSPDFFEGASFLSDGRPGTTNQAFGGAAASFPTKLSTETVGDFKNAYGS